MKNEVEKFYDNNQDFVEDLFQEYISENEWGSGEDKIKIDNDFFWDFVEQVYENIKNET